MIKKFICSKGFPALSNNCALDTAPSHGPFVLATDYAALEAERDEWKRRCEATLAMLAPESKALYRAALAIAEGRDNG